jgi:hypothetical protein
MTTDRIIKRSTALTVLGVAALAAVAMSGDILHL